MSELKQALVIYNPASGTVGDLDKRLGAIVRRLHEDSNYMVTVRATEPGLSAEQLLAAPLGEFELVIACGGDGTVGVVLGAVAETQIKAKVGIVPFGTGNLLAHNLGIYPPKLKGDVIYHALDIILEGESVSMDLGKLNDRWFTVDAGTGPIANALTIPKQKHKRIWRLFVYVLPLLRSMARGPRAFKISIDGEPPMTMAASGVFVTTIGEMGIGNAYDYTQLNNGSLDLIVMNPRSLLDYWRTTWRFALWNIFGVMQPGDPPYLVRKIKTVDIDVLGASHLKWPVHTLARKIKNFLRRKPDLEPAVTEHASAMVDGDRCGSTPMHIEIVPNAVQLIVPKEPGVQVSPSLKQMDKVVTHAA